MALFKGITIVGGILLGLVYYYILGYIPINRLLTAIAVGAGYVLVRAYVDK